MKNEIESTNFYSNPGISHWLKCLFGTIILILAVTAGVISMKVKGIALDDWQGILLYTFAGIIWLIMLTQIPKWKRMYEAEILKQTKIYIDLLKATRQSSEEEDEK